MKKYIAGVIALVVISAAVYLVSGNRSPFGRKNTSFASVPEAGITRIEISRDKEKLVLERSGEKWLLDGEEGVRKQAVIFLLRILQEMQIKSPVSPGMFTAEVTSAGIEPVRVRTWEKRKMLNSFLVYKSRSNAYGNIMKKKEGSKPFIVYVPGFDGNIGSAFTLNRLYWKPFTIFNMLPSEIQAVSLENAADTASSFSIEFNDDKPRLLADHRSLAGWDSTLVLRYLSYFTFIPFESWAADTDTAEKEEIASRLPLYRIKVVSPGGKEKILSLFERKIEKNGSVITDTDRLYGKTGDSEELFIVRYFDIDPILKRRSYFFRHNN